MDAFIRIYGTRFICVCVWIECNTVGTREDLRRRRNHRCHSSFGRVCVLVCIMFYFLFIRLSHLILIKMFNCNMRPFYRMATIRSMNLFAFFSTIRFAVSRFIELNWILMRTWNLCHFGIISNSFSSFSWNNMKLCNIVFLCSTSISTFVRHQHVHISHNMRLVMSIFFVACIIFSIFSLDYALHVCFFRGLLFRWFCKIYIFIYWKRTRRRILITITIQWWRWRQ